MASPAHAPRSPGRTRRATVQYGFIFWLSTCVLHPAESPNHPAKWPWGGGRGGGGLLSNPRCCPLHRHAWGRAHPGLSSPAARTPGSGWALGKVPRGTGPPAERRGQEAEKNLRPSRRPQRPPGLAASCGLRGWRTGEPALPRRDTGLAKGGGGDSAPRGALSLQLAGSGEGTAAGWAAVGGPGPRPLGLLRPPGGRCSLST